MKHLSVALALSLGLQFCSKSSFTNNSTTASKKEATKITMRLEADPPTLDWTKATDNLSKEVLSPLHVGLTYQDKNSQAQGSLAESWELSADKKTYTFRLKKNLKWSDGKALVAQHFIDGWERLLNPKTGAEYASFLFDVAGAEDYFTGKNKDFNAVQAKALDPESIQVTLREPAAYWIHVPAFWVSFPVRKDVIAEHGDRWTQVENYVSAGPYKLLEWKRESKILLGKNPHYHNQEELKSMVDFIEYRVVKENAVAVTLFDNKKLDIVRKLPPLQVPMLAQGNKGFKKSSYYRGYYVGFNKENPLVSDVRVRKALAMSIDRKQIKKFLTEMIEPQSNWIPVGMIGADTSRGIKFNQSEAKKLWDSLENAPQEITYWYPQEEMHKLVAEFLQEQWKTHLGLKVNLMAQEWKVYLKTVKQDKLPIFRLGWGADYPDPHTFMELFTCLSQNNNTSFCNQEYDANIKKAVYSTDNATRSSAYAIAEKILLEDEIAIVPLFKENKLHLVSPRISGVEINQMGDFQYSQLRIKD